MKRTGSILFSLTIFFVLYVENGIAETALDHPVLHIAGWDVYADPEHQDKIIGYKSFEEKTGYKIEFTPLNNLDEIIQYAETAKHVDVLIISNEGIDTLCKMNLVRQLDIDRIPYYQDLHPSLRYTNWAQFDGHVYAVPWAWGPTGLIYDSKRITEPESWNILWDPKYKGKISLWDDVSMIWTTALSLGYTNVYNLTAEQLVEVKNKILQLNGQVHSYYKSGKEEIDLLVSGDVLIANSWFDPSARLKKHNKYFKMIIPKEGAVGMFDSYLISKNSEADEISHAFINHQISPEVQIQMTRVTGLEPSNIETLALMTQTEIRDLHLNDQSYFRRMILWNKMPRKDLYEKLMKEIRQQKSQRDLPSQ